jgi:hypothetical protein
MVISIILVWQSKGYDVLSLRKVWRYQRDNQKPQLEEGHSMQWQKKRQKDKQRWIKQYTE